MTHFSFKRAHGHNDKCGNYSSLVCVFNSAEMGKTLIRHNIWVTAHIHGRQKSGASKFCLSYVFFARRQSSPKR